MLKSLRCLYLGFCQFVNLNNCILINSALPCLSCITSWCVPFFCASYKNSHLLLCLWHILIEHYVVYELEKYDIIIRLKRIIEPLTSTTIHLKLYSALQKLNLFIYLTASIRNTFSISFLAGQQDQLKHLL